MADHIAVAGQRSEDVETRDAYCNVARLLERFAQLRQKARTRTGEVFLFVVIQEAGLDEFWIHPVLFLWGGGGAVAERLHWFWGLRNLDLGRRRGEALRDAAHLEHTIRAAGLPRCAPLRQGSARANKRSPGPSSCADQKERTTVISRPVASSMNTSSVMGAAILKPPMLAAVDLDQLADAVASGARLMDELSPLLAFVPQPGLDHPQPPGLASERYSINLTQLLAFETLLEALSALVFRYSGRRTTSR